MTSAPLPPRRYLAALGSLLSCLLLTGCPDEGVVCSEGLSRCGDTCVDLTSESANCGTCGTACGSGQLCADGACRCLTGTTACDGACVDTQSSPQHCGGCASAGGAVCDSWEVCMQGECQGSCAGGMLQCSNGCINPAVSNLHCGACDNACGDARSCRGGVCTYDVVATCFNTGQVVGIQSGSDLKGPGTLVASSPQSAARMMNVLLVLDSTRKLVQARLKDYGVLPARNDTGRAPNQILVLGTYLYILNSADNTLQMLRREGDPIPPGPRDSHYPDGIPLTDIASVSFGANTNPFAMTRVGNRELWVTLYGNLLGDPSAGGRVARVSLNDFSTPVIMDTLELPSGAALKPFPGNTTLSTPAGITEHRGKVYVALNNLNPATYSPGGPGLLARIDPTSRAVDLIELGEGCLNPGSVAPVGEQLLVSCSGKAVYDSEFKLLSVERSALVLLDAQDRVVSTAPIQCSPGIGSCPIPAAGRFAVVGNRSYLGDTNGGRIFVHEVVGNTLVERRGLLDTSEPAIAACPASGFSLVSDVVALDTQY